VVIGLLVAWSRPFHALAVGVHHPQVGLGLRLTAQGLEPA
jgi:hypothetical protein